MNKQLTISQQCALLAKAANLGCIRKSVASRSMEMIFPLFLALVRYLECWVQFQAHQYKRDRDIME